MRKARNGKAVHRGIHRGIAALLLVTSLVHLQACSDSSSSNTSPATRSIGLSPYQAGPHAVQSFKLAAGEQGSPKETLIFSPTSDGQFALIQFQHGFTSDIDSYTDLLEKLSSFGFVVVAPQIYSGDPSSAPSVAEETADAVSFLAWAQGNINAVLDSLVPATQNISVLSSPAKTGLTGHSRGGQVIWRILFDYPQLDQASAVAGIDPVDGDAPPFPPGGTGELVSDDPGAFNFEFPSLVLGMGLGDQGVPGFECAPANRNYQLFYDASAAPRYEVVADDYGHSDMLNGNNPNGVCFGALDGSNEALRVFIAGQLAAYFYSTLFDQNHYQFLRSFQTAPIAASGRFED